MGGRGCRRRRRLLTALRDRRLWSSVCMVHQSRRWIRPRRWCLLRRQSPRRIRPHRRVRPPRNRAVSEKAMSSGTPLRDPKRAGVMKLAITILGYTSTLQRFARRGVKIRQSTDSGCGQSSIQWRCNDETVARPPHEMINEGFAHGASAVAGRRRHWWHLHRRRRVRARRCALGFQSPFHPRGSFKGVRTRSCGPCHGWTGSRFGRPRLPRHDGRHERDAERPTRARGTADHRGLPRCPWR